MSRFRWLFALLAAVALTPLAAAAQQGVLTGRVTAQETGEPLPSAQVIVQGTALRALTDAQGTYRIPNVPAGRYTVSASYGGRETDNRPVTLAAGQAVTLNFPLGISAVALEGLVVTATGEQQRTRELGNSVGQLNVAEDVPLAAVNDVAQVLQGRMAGVTVLQASGTTGTGARIRIRGSNSVSLSNDPLLIIDGVRIDNGNGSSLGVGGQTPNRLNDLNAEDIESMEVLKGPAASALYGTAAANGVIVVNTKKGRAGSTRWRVYTEQGTIQEPNDFPANFSGFCTVTAGSRDFTIPGCDTQSIFDFRDRGFTVTVDSVQSFNPLENSETTPFADGSRQKYGLSASGGTDQVTYFLSGDLEDEVGVYEDVNSLEKVSLRANLRSQLRDNLDVTVNSGYVNSDLRLPQNDNNILGIVSSAFLGGATQETGFGFFTLDELKFLRTNQSVERFTSSANGRFTPLAWLSFNGTAGLDVVNRFDNETLPAQRIFFGSLGEGQRSSNRIKISSYTANLNSTANYDIASAITGTSSVGVQYNQEIFRGTYAFGRGLLPGSSSLNGTATGFSVGEANSDIRTVGGYFQQQVALNDRIYLTGAVRADDNSAFGRDFGLIYYPSVSASWVVAEEPWFPQVNALSLFRLRAAYGESGLRPGFRDAVRFLSPRAVTVGGISVPGFTLGGIGNAGLRPERTSEVEFGFDLGLLDDRIGAEFTYYNKQGNDRVILRPVAPSLGVSTSRFDNLGEVQNKGVELLVNTKLLNRDRFRWDLTFTGSLTDNELVELGTDPVSGNDIEPIIFGLGGNTQRHQEGFPLGSYFQRPILGFNDDNGDGLITADEVQVGDTAVFLGSPFPTEEASLSSNMTFFNVVKVSGLLDYRGGYRNFNSTERFRCGAFFNCRAAFAAYPGVEATLEEQADYIATAVYGTSAGYIEEADFVKLRELAVTFMLPTRFARTVGASGLNLSLAGRNLATWTNYSGLDPETNFAGSGSNFTTAEFLTQPPLRYYTVRLDLNF